MQDAAAAVPSVQGEPLARRTPALRPTNRFKLTVEELQNELSDQQRRMLFTEIASSVRFFLGLERPVYLDGFGILIPELREVVKSQTIDEQVIVRSERQIAIRFEKYSELVSFHQEKYPGIIETKELSQRVFPRLAPFFPAVQQERDLHRYVRGAIEGLKRATIHDGHSTLLAEVGTFFALHNRSGNSLTEWFAGADIFLRSSTPHVVSSRQCDIFSRPVLKNGWELLIAAYGQPVRTFNLDLNAELSGLGYEVASPSEALSVPIKVAGFDLPCLASDRDKKVTMLFCTDGLRARGLSASQERRLGNEFTVQISFDEQKESREHVEREVCRMLTLAWILIEGSKSKTIRHGTGVLAPSPLFASEHHGLQGVFATRFLKAPGEHLSAEGPFSYMNLVAVCEDEAALASSVSFEHLYALLEYRHLHQVIQPRRVSILSRGAIVPSQGNASVANG